ncbi:MAG TPA: GNAT family N-acetyltransferase [Elusimicrobiota bacterium]|jgi:GNAT superfamily N-acetyltransferase|nr:GNAT family N-acetyltransferase [Elusimicrobiota bacterium]
MSVVPLEGPLQAYAFQGMTFRAYVPALFAARAEGSAFRAFGAFDETDEPEGLLLVRLDAPRAELMSIFTRADRRRRGVARALLAAAEKSLAAAGVSRLEASLERGRPLRDAAEKLLAGAGYGPFERTSLMVRFRGSEKVRQAPWLRRLEVPAAFEVFPWAELRREERDAIVARQERELWIPEDLFPFRGEEWLEPGNSLGLRYRGEVVAWQVNHRPLPDVLRYTYTFARADLQRYGLAVALLAESVRRHLDGPLALAAPNATFKVPARFEGMRRFAEKHWRGFADELNEIVKGSKRLA